MPLNVSLSVISVHLSLPAAPLVNRKIIWLETWSKHILLRLRSLFLSEITNLDKKHAKRLKCDRLAGLCVWESGCCVYVRYDLAALGGRMISWFHYFLRLRPLFVFFYVHGLENKTRRSQGVNAVAKWKEQNGTSALINYVFPRHEKEGKSWKIMLYKKRVFNWNEWEFIINLRWVKAITWKWKFTN